MVKEKKTKFLTIHQINKKATRGKSSSYGMTMGSRKGEINPLYNAYIEALSNPENEYSPEKRASKDRCGHDIKNVFHAVINSLNDRGVQYNLGNVYRDIDWNEFYPVMFCIFNNRKMLNSSDFRFFMWLLKVCRRQKRSLYPQWLSYGTWKWLREKAKSYG